MAGIEYLIKNQIINVPGVEITENQSATEIPDWIQNNAGWWANSLITDDDFIEYEYTANDLDEFIAFAIKIRMQGVNSSEPPRIKDLRAIALAT